ncbi:MAG: molybdopterin molybdenumtransferase MoeA [Candidatus Lokiarchaeota archaeon]|nr:molybdopterin molybdenumtransferase MoeA [Candidatus Lokiarchaeota archaeon]
MEKKGKIKMSSIHNIGFKKLTPVDDAWDYIYKHSKYMETEIIKTIESIGRITAEKIISNINVPHFVRSAMDGYAIKAEDSFNASQHKPNVLKVIDEIGISKVSNMILKNGEAIKLATGSPIPQGADAVIKIEETKKIDDNIEIYFSVPRGKNVQREGEDVKSGDLILKQMHLIRPQDIGMLLACGEFKVKVYKKPTVAIISTGNELIEHEKKLDIGQIYETNSYMLMNHTTLYGGIPIRIGKAIDDVKVLNEMLFEALKYDIIVFTGGTSVGELDLLPKIMEMNGEILVHGISMRPGSPTAISVVNNKLIFCLPGFPVASIIAFETFVGPYIRYVQRYKLIEPRPKIKIRLGKAVPSVLGRRDFVRIRIEETETGFVAIPTRASGSGIISSTVNADGILIIPEEREGFEKDELVNILLYMPYNKSYW